MATTLICTRLCIELIICLSSFLLYDKFESPEVLVFAEGNSFQGLLCLIHVFDLNYNLF